MPLSSDSWCWIHIDLWPKLNLFFWGLKDFTRFPRYHIVAIVKA
jgi:hypothetical protein